MRTRSAVGLLVLVVIGFYAAVLVAGEPAARVPATLAVLTTLPPAVGTLLGVVRVCRTKQDAGPLAALAATGLRMVWAAGVVAFIGRDAEELGTTAGALTNWVVAFYVFGLAIETVLLWRLLGRARP